MKKEFWRKAPQCPTCTHHCPEGKRLDSIDPKTIWKEACRFCGYSFWPELEDAEICFDFKSQGRDSLKSDKAAKDKWAREHPCLHCAFYETNGIEYYDHPERGKLEDWNAEHRCRGYVPIKEKDKNGFCSSYLSVNQWAEVESTPIYEGQRIRKWDEFRAINTK